jgi:tetratricopeptide (TPR) repeat protein
MLKYFLFLLPPFFLFTPPAAPSLEPDDTQAAWEQLETSRRQVDAGPEGTLELLRLGAWEEAHTRLQEANQAADPLGWGLVAARWHHLNNAFSESEKRVNQLLEKAPEAEELLLLQAELRMEAWELKEARKILEEKLSGTPRGQYLLGKIELFRKQYPQALERAISLQQAHPSYPKAYLLEAEAHFWQRNIQAAEAALQQCLRLDPFDPDARFYYGYAIWRRVDATQLPAMAAQWELALAVHPLHYLTHWHWGNGHTQLTYADYLDPRKMRSGAPCRKLSNPLHPIKWTLPSDKFKRSRTNTLNR